MSLPIAPRTLTKSVWVSKIRELRGNLMIHKLVPRWALTVLTTGALLLPIAVCVMVGVGALLGAMGDVQGGVALKRIALGGGVLWAIDLICLIVALGLSTLGDHDQTGEP